MFERQLLMLWLFVDWFLLMLCRLTELGSMESIWKYNGGPSASHFLVALYSAFAFVAARFFLDRFVFRVSFLYHDCISLVLFWSIYSEVLVVLFFGFILSNPMDINKSADEVNLFVVFVINWGGDWCWNLHNLQVCSAFSKVFE